MQIQKQDGWYIAKMQFKTKYNTIATAYGYGVSFMRAIADCLQDYKVIKSL